MPILQKNLLFIHIPKTGGTSVEKTVGQNLFPRPIVRSLLAKIRSVDRQAHSAQRRVLFGRCPIDLAIQHLTLEELVSLGIIQLSDVYEKFVCFSVIRNPFARVLSQWRSHSRSERYKDVNDFVENWLFSASTRKSHGSLVHSRPQSDFLKLSEFYTRQYGQNPAVAILRTESLSSDFLIFKKKHNLDLLKLPHVNRRGNDPFEYRRILSEQSRKYIEKFYEQDFEAFQYDW